VLSSTRLTEDGATRPLPASPSRWSLGVGAGVAATLVRPVGPAFLVDGAFDHAHWSAALGALWIPDEKLAVPPGFVDVQLLSASARGCAFAGRNMHLGGCIRLFGGALLASGSGYTIDTRETRPWFAAALELFLGGPIPLVPIAHLRYRLAFDAIVPLHAEEFSVAGAGTAYATPSFGGLFTFSLEITTFAISHK